VKTSLGEAVDQYAKTVSQFGILLALLLTMGAVAQEKDRGTAALMLSKPLPRWVFLLAKFLALALTFTVSLLLSGIAAYYYTLLLFEAPDLGSWLALHGLMLVALLVYVALTLLCSTLTSSQVVGGGLAFGLLILLSGVGAIPGLGERLPNHLITWGSALVKGATESFWPALWISVGLIAAALVAAWVIFERQEL
jgi:ABC-2 type transport system permease protein